MAAYESANRPRASVASATSRIDVFGISAGFVLRAVLVGAYTQSTYAENVTLAFKRGTAHFDLLANDGNSVVLTVDLWARTPTFGARYSCPITIRSAVQPSVSDTVVAKLVTCYRNCLRLQTSLRRR